MKIVELDEGVKDWFARKGLFGTKAAIAAAGKHLTGLQQQASGTVFTQHLSNALAQAMNSGLIPRSLSKENFVLNYMNSLLKNYNLDPSSELQLQRLSTEFANRFTGSVDSMPQAEAKKLFDFVQALKSTRQNDSYPNPTGPDTVTTDRAHYEFDGTKWHMVKQRVPSSTSRSGFDWQDLSPKVEVTKPEHINKLNKLAAST